MSYKLRLGAIIIIRNGAKTISLLKLRLGDLTIADGHKVMTKAHIAFDRWTNNVKLWHNMTSKLTLAIQTTFLQLRTTNNCKETTTWIWFHFKNKILSISIWDLHSCWNCRLPLILSKLIPKRYTNMKNNNS